MSSFKFYIVICLLNILLVRAEISDKRLCANPDCSELISLAKTILRFPSNDDKVLSFPPNVDVKIYSKSAGSNTNLWGAEINGKRGYVPKTLIKEYKIYKKKLEYLIDTELNENKTPEIVPTTEKITPSATLEPFEVIDGTTIFLNPDAVPTTTETTYEKPKEEPKEEKDQIPTPAADIKEEKIIEASHISETTSSDAKIEENLQKDGKLIEATKEAIVESKEKSEDGNGKIIEDAQKAADIKPNEDLNEKEEGKTEPKLETHKESIVNPKASSISNLIGEKKEETSKDDDEAEVEVEDEDGDDEEEEDDDDEDYDDDEGEEEEEETDNEQKEKKATVDDTTKPKSDENKVIENLTNGQAKPEETSKPSPENSQEPVINKKVEEISTVPKAEENINVQKDPPQDILKEIISNSVDNVTNDLIKDAEAKILKESTIGKLSSEDASKVEIKQSDATSQPIINTIVIPNDSPKEEVASSEQISQSEESKNVSGELGNRDEINISGSVPTSQASNEVPPITINSAENNVEVMSTEVNTEASLPNEDLNPLDVQGLYTTQPTVQTFEENIQLKLDAPIEAAAKTPAENIDVPSMNIDNDKDDNNFDDILNSSTITLDKEDQPLFIDDVHTEGKSSEKLIESNQPGLFSGIFSNMFSSGNNDKTIENEDNSDLKFRDELPPAFTVDGGINMDTTSENILIQTTEPFETNIPEITTAAQPEEPTENPVFHDKNEDILISKQHDDIDACTVDPHSSHCHKKSYFEEMTSQTFADSFNVDFTDVYKLVGTVAVAGFTVTFFLWGYMFFDKKKREGELVAKINSLEKLLLIERKQNDDLNEELANSCDPVEKVDSGTLEELEILRAELEISLAAKAALEDQVQGLEKDLENSTEVGLELNRMLTEMLNSQNGSDILVANIEQLQRQLIEQQATINSVNESLSIRDTENHELQLELEIRNKKLVDIQEEYAKVVSNITELEEEKEHLQCRLESELANFKDQLQKTTNSSNEERLKYLNEIKALKKQCSDLQRNLDVKINEYNLLKDSVQEVKNVKNNNEAFKSLLEVSSIKAELQQLQRDNKLLAEHLQQGEEIKLNMQKKMEESKRELQNLKTNFDEAERAKLEAQTKLEVLSNYFTDKEAQLQKELSRQESMWIEKQGEATTVSERIKHMQEELQNCKALNESLKKEIVAQEVQLKSQISVLEKRAHDNWVEARQAERKLESAKQEAAQLRNKMTMRERTLNEEKGHNRMQSPLEQNGDIVPSPLHMQVEAPASPPLIYGRENLTTSPPLPGLPPFLPPPPGVPFMPPPIPGVVPPFMPPPHAMFPGDHRPPPLGRMSSPPLNSRYSPDSRAYSPYSRNSPSPPYDDDYDTEYTRGYSSYERDTRRDYRRPPPPSNRINNRNNKGSNLSSGSAHSSESIEKINRHHSKV